MNQAVHAALTNLDARPAPAGEMTVVLGSGDVHTIEGTGLRPAQSGLVESAAAKLRVRRSQSP